MIGAIGEVRRIKQAPTVTKTTSKTADEQTSDRRILSGVAVWTAAAAMAFGMLLVAPSAFAQSLEERIIDALQPKPKSSLFGGATRGLGAPKATEQRAFVRSLRSRPARSLTLTERTKVKEFAKTKPSIDIEINFEYDSDVVGPKALKPLLALGRALSSEQLKGAVFLLSGHTDAKGSAAYNQGLSERRAEAVKRVLVREFDLPADTLIAVGHGESQLKNAIRPFAGENRRVQVVNTEVK